MATTKEPQAAVEGVADQAQGAGQQVAGGGKQVADQAQGAGQQVADQAQGAGQQVADQAQEAGGKATGQDDSDDDGVYKQLKKVATTALVAALGPAVKKGVTGLAEQAVKKGPELVTSDLLPKVAKAGGAKKIASGVLDKLKGGDDEDGGGILGMLPGMGGGGDDGGGGSRGDSPEGTGAGRRMPVQQSVDVAAPVDVVYNQFTQFEDYPKFMHRVQSVEQRDETHVVFRSKQWKVKRHWEAEIVDQRPDERIVARGVDGVKMTTAITFHELAPRLTRVEVNADFDPEGFFEKVGRGMRFVKRQIRGDLHRFKAYVEMHEAETGEWRGFVDDGEVVSEEEYWGEEADGEEPVAEEEPAEGDEPEDEPLDEEEDLEEEPVAEEELDEDEESAEEPVAEEDEDLDAQPGDEVEEQEEEPAEEEPVADAQEAEAEAEAEQKQKPKRKTAAKGRSSKASGSRNGGSASKASRSKAKSDGASDGGSKRAKGGSRAKSGSKAKS